MILVIFLHINDNIDVIIFEWGNPKEKSLIKFIQHFILYRNLFISRLCRYDKYSESIHKEDSKKNLQKSTHSNWQIFICSPPSPTPATSLYPSLILCESIVRQQAIAYISVFCHGRNSKKEKKKTFSHAKLSIHISPWEMQIVQIVFQNSIKSKFMRLNWLTLVMHWQICIICRMSLHIEENPSNNYDCKRSTEITDRNFDIFDRSILHRCSFRTREKEGEKNSNMNRGSKCICILQIKRLWYSHLFLYLPIFSLNSTLEIINEREEGVG